MRLSLALCLVSSVLLAGCSSSRPRRTVTVSPGAPRVAVQRDGGEWDATLQRRVFLRGLESGSARGGQVGVVHAAARPARSLAQVCTPFRAPPPPPLPSEACVPAVPCPPAAASEACPGGNCSIPSYEDACPGGVCGIPSPAAVVRRLTNPFCK